MDQYIGKMLDNRYEILELIGSGGMANVYKAKCHRLNRMVAVKILKNDLAENAAFRLPTCTRRFPRDIGKERPCLNHHMGRCDGFCRGEPDAEEYQKRIEQACSLLSGHYKTLARELKTEMEHEAEQLHFEQAAVLRDRIAAIEVLGKRQKVIAGVCADTDVWGLYTGAAKSGCAVVHVEDGSVTGRETSIFTAPTDETEADTLSALLSQYYLPRGASRHAARAAARRKGGAACHGRAQRPRGGRARHYRRRARGQNAQEPCCHVRSERRAKTHGILRYFQYRRERHRCVDGRLRRREAAQARLPPL